MAREITIDTGVSNTKYIRVSPDGKFVQRIGSAMTSEEHAAKDHERTKDITILTLTKGPNEGKIVWERKRKEFEGQLVDIRFDDSGNYGDEWSLRFDVTEPGAAPEFINLQFNADSDIANSIVLKMPSITDFSKDLRVMAYALDTDREGNKMEYSRLGVALYEDGAVKVSPFYTKDNPGGMPKWKTVTVNGKKVMDKTDALEFIKNMMLNEVLPKVKAVAPTEPEPKPEAIKAVEQAFGEGDAANDELPF